MEEMNEGHDLFYHKPKRIMMKSFIPKRIFDMITIVFRGGVKLTTENVYSGQF